MKKLLIGVFALLMLLPSLAFADTAVYGTWDRNPSGSSVLLPNGSAAAPALSFTNDTDTGFWWSATQLNLSIGGSAVWVMSANAMTTTFASGVDAEIGRGTTDTDVTYIALRATDGTKIYIYTDGISLILSTTAP